MPEAIKIYLERINSDYQSKLREGLSYIDFGSKIKSQELLTSFDLGKGNRSQLTEVLFIERCVDLLKPRGTLGIVVPDGVLSNISLSNVRAFIRNNSLIRAIISVPHETFSPYGSGVKASLLFLQKKDVEGKLKQEKVFMAVADNIGYDATGRMTGKNDLPKILEIYKKQEW